MSEIIMYIMAYGTIALWIIITIFIFKFLFRSILKQYHSNWNTLIDNFDFSPKEFYQRLGEELQSHGIRNIRAEETYIREGVKGVSPSRIYLRVRWKKYEYNVCAAKFGNGFFVSWWLLYRNSIWKILIARIPVVGDWLAMKLYPITYYSVDTASMFMTYAQRSVLKVIDEITKEKGVRTLTESERKPILNDVFKR